jgi:hypothetical protein
MVLVHEGSRHRGTKTKVRLRALTRPGGEKWASRGSPGVQSCAAHHRHPRRGGPAGGRDPSRHGWGRTDWHRAPVVPSHSSIWGLRCCPSELIGFAGGDVHSGHDAPDRPFLACVMPLYCGLRSGFTHGRAAAGLECRPVVPDWPGRSHFSQGKPSKRSAAPPRRNRYLVIQQLLGRTSWRVAIGAENRPSPSARERHHLTLPQVASACA